MFLKYLLDRNLVHMLELPTFRGLGQPKQFCWSSPYSWGFWTPFAIRMQCISGFRKCISASAGHCSAAPHPCSRAAFATVCCTSIWYLTDALKTNALTSHSTNLVTRFWCNLLHCTPHCPTTCEIDLIFISILCDLPKCPWSELPGELN